MKKIALVTCSEFPRLSQSDQLLISPLKTYGFDPIIAPWDDTSINWGQFQMVILRSAWNYHYRYTQFMEWLDAIENTGVPLYNSPSLVRWNSKKTYLRDLNKKGVATIPTEYLTQHSMHNLPQFMEVHGWNEAVVKPAVGASAYEIFRVSKNSLGDGQKRLDKLLAKGDCLLQPLMKEVEHAGEYSFVFIAGKYSHCILKVPPEGEFRSNYGFGGQEIMITPDHTLKTQAERVISCIKSKTLYARVDGIRKKNAFILMELELIEPHLFFDYHPQSAERFALECKKFI